MYLQHLNIYFFFGLILAVGTLVYFLFQPFLTAIVAAAILAALFQGPHRWLLNKLDGRASTASFLTCLLIIFVIVAPIFMIISAVANEANNLYHLFGEGKTVDQFLVRLVNGLNGIPYLSKVIGGSLNQEALFQSIQGFSGNFIDIFQAAYRQVSQFVFWMFILFFTLYYFLIDGVKGLRYLMTISPLRDEHEQLLVTKFISMTRATMKGTLVIGAIQSVIGGILFWVVGVPSPVVWATVMFFFSIIPMVGTGAVWFPIGLIFLFLGDFWQGALVLGIGFGVISVIDNVLRPKLVGKDTQMHPLLVFFATLGGIALFGLPGFILGPIVVSLFMALWEIYGIEFRKQLDSYNDPNREYRKEV